MAKKILVTQTRSGIKQTDRMKRTLKSLGLGRIGKTAEHNMTQSIIGMINAVEHLVVVRLASGAGIEGKSGTK